MSAPCKCLGIKALTSGGAAQRSTSTRAVAELGAWLNREVPRSRVSTFALPCAQGASSSSLAGSRKRGSRFFSGAEAGPEVDQDSLQRPCRPNAKTPHQWPFGMTQSRATCGNHHTEFTEDDVGLDS